MIRRGLKLGLFASLLCLIAGVHNVSTQQGDPLELQRRAIQRIEHRRSLLTLTRADVTEIEIVGVEPILPIIFGGR